MKWWKHIPNALTMLNLIFGTLAIISMANALIPTALILMLLCLVADILDGMLARKMGVSGPLGVQLDSLADVVSFGVLPAMMIFYMGARFGGEFPGQQAVGVIGALVAASAGLRLARFNIDEKPRNYFWGLATPSGAMMIAGWLWAQHIGKDYGLGVADHHWLIILLPAIILIAYQVPLRLPGLKSPKEGLITLGIISAGMILGLVLLGPISIPLGFLTYLLAGILNHFIRWY